MKRSTVFQKQIMSVLKSKAKSLGITQEKLANDLNISLPTLKRWFAGKGVDLSTLKVLCDILGISFIELASASESSYPKPSFYTHEQEKFFSENPACLAFFDYLIRGFSVSHIEKKFQLGTQKIQKILGQLEKNGLIDWLPKNKVRVKFLGEPTWRKDGALAKKFKFEILDSFLKNSELGRFSLYDFLPEDIEQIEFKCQELFHLTKQAHQRAQLSPERSKPYGIFLMLKGFRWQIDKYLSNPVDWI